MPPRPVVFAAAQRLGMRYVIQPAATDWSSREAVDEIAARLQRWMEAQGLMR